MGEDAVMNENEAGNPALCVERVWRGGTWDGKQEPCGKKVKDRGLCGSHLRSILLDEKRRDDSAAAAKLARKLSDHFGIPVRSQGVHHRAGEFEFVISAVAAKQWAAQVPGPSSVAEQVAP